MASRLTAEAEPREQDAVLNMDAYAIFRRGNGGIFAALGAFRCSAC